MKTCWAFSEKSPIPAEAMAALNGQISFNSKSVELLCIAIGRSPGRRLGKWSRPFIFHGRKREQTGSHRTLLIMDIRILWWKRASNSPSSNFSIKVETSISRVSTLMIEQLSTILFAINYSPLRTSLSPTLLQLSKSKFTLEFLFRNSRVISPPPISHIFPDRSAHICFTSSSAEVLTNDTSLLEKRFGLCVYT